MRLRNQGVTTIAGLVSPAASYSASAPIPVGSITGGPGVVVYQSLGFAGATDLTYLERCMQVTVDGEATPSLISSGCEDWFGSAYYFQTLFPAYAMGWGCNGSNFQAGMAIDFVEAFGGIPFNASCAFSLVASGIGQATDIACTRCFQTVYYQ